MSNDESIDLHSDEARRSTGLDLSPAEVTVADQALEELDFLPPEHRERVGMVLERTISQISHISGPLPAASEMARYKEIDPTLIEWLKIRADKEQDFRHSIPPLAIDRDYKLKSRGQNYALAACTLVLLFAAYISYLGNTSMGGKVAISTLVGLVSVFVGGRVIDIFARRGESDDNDN